MSPRRPSWTSWRRIDAVCSNAGFTKFELHARSRQSDLRNGGDRLAHAAQRGKFRDRDCALDVAPVQAVVETNRLLGQVLAALLAENATPDAGPPRPLLQMHYTPATRRRISVFL